MTTYIDPRGKLFGHLDRIAQLQAGLHPPPVNVEIDLSNRCQLGCEFCHFAYTHSRGPHSRASNADLGDLMNTSLALHIAQTLARYIRSITWSGGGEPTLHPDLEHILRATSIDQGMYTNGQISREQASVLKQYLTWVYVSLDCPDRESYAKIKQVDKFDTAVSGIRMLVEADGNATVGMGVLLSANTYQHAPAALALGRELSVDYIQYRPIIRYKPAAPGEPAEDTRWVEHAVEMLDSLDYGPDVIVDPIRFLMYGDWRNHGYTTCWWSGLQTVITPDGRVWGCVNKRGREDALLGDLNEQSFAEIWQDASIQPVNESCRIMCRGHIPNLALRDMMEERVHANFI